MSRMYRWMPVAGLLVAALGLAPATAENEYRIVARLSSIMDGQPLAALRFDPTSHRLFAVNVVGLYSADLSAAAPKMIGPLAKTPNIGGIDVAPDLSRVFYSSLNEIGYIDENGGKPVKISTLQGSGLVYEPTRHEVYTATEFNGSPYVLVFDAQTGQLRTTIKLDRSPYGFQAIPGSVFCFLDGQDGIYAIDAKTHVVARWPVTGSLVTPGNLEVDPSGRYLFLARAREIDAIDVPTHTVIGRLSMPGTASIGFDPSSAVLIAAWPSLSEQRDQLAVLRPTADGLTEVGTLKNDAGGTQIVRTNYGFIQRTYNEFLIWSAQAPTTRH
jgi:DNA-binding beta-propeller fold protein YncE